MTLSVLNTSVKPAESTNSMDMLVQFFGRTLLITLNRPRALNALTIPMIQQLYLTIKDVHDNFSADLVIMKSASDRAFCAGGDILEIKRSSETDGTMHKMFYVYEYLIDYMLGTLPVPFVALINGITMGAGCGLCFNGRFRVATERTLMAMPEVGVGLFPDAGSTYLLPRLPNQLGMFIGLTGYRLRGADTFHSGLATHYVDSAQLANLETQLLSLSEPTSVDVDTLLTSFQCPTIPAFSLAPYLSEINEAFRQETLEALVICLKQSKNAFLLDQLKAIEKASPISLKVTFHQLRLGSHLQFAEVFPIEYRLIQRLVANPNFLEGCRALLVDKDYHPQWIPSRIEDVTDADIQHQYAPLSNDLDMSAKL